MIRIPSLNVAVIVTLLVSAATHAAEPTPAELVRDAKRILFLGDSITASGQYVGYLDAWLTATRGESAPKVIDAGLPSETVSGLSEEGHAGGAFPRPDLFERLERVLKLTKPDLVFACYGINCGVYEPFDEGRFAKYQAGMQRLKKEIEAAGAKLIVVTPPFYDDLRAPKAFSYNAVLDRYSAWLVGQGKEGWAVIDLHSAMTAFVTARRQADAKFTLQPDGVHPSGDGHWFMARTILLGLGEPRAVTWKTPAEMTAALKLSDKQLSLVQERVGVLRDAYVAAAGHKRPGVAKGLPVEQAEAKAAELTAKIDSKP